MPANRAAEFAHLAAAAQTPGYRRLWTSQAEWYRANDQRRTTNDESGNPFPDSSFAIHRSSFPKLRLASESAWAALFDALNVAWEYNARFWLPDRAAWVEVKEAAPTVGEFEAARALAAGGRVYFFSGWPARKRFGVWVLATEGEFMAVRADFRDLALGNLLGVSFGRLYEGMEEVRI